MFDALPRRSEKRQVAPGLEFHALRQQALSVCEPKVIRVRVGTTTGTAAKAGGAELVLAFECRSSGVADLRMQCRIADRGY